MKNVVCYSVCMLLISFICVSAEEIHPGDYTVGSISKGEVDTYFFDADAGEYVSVLIGEITDYGGFSPQIEFFDPDGTRTSVYGTQSASINAAKIKKSGSCMIIVHSYNWVSEGIYALSVIKNPGTDVNDIDDDPVAIMPGELKSGYIDVGDLDGYTFEAAAGDVVTILMSETGDYGGFDPRVELIEPDGTRTYYSLSSRTSADFIDAKKISKAGTCMIIAREYNGYQTGTYNLSMVKTASTDLSEPVNSPVLLTAGQLATGVIEKGQLNGYTFNASAGDIITILMGEMIDCYGFSPQLDLIEPNGTRAYFTGSESAVINAKKLSETGTYMLIARSSSGYAEGMYGLTMLNNSNTLENDSQDSAVAIKSGDVKNGSISKGDLDAYIFQADAGDAVNIVMSEVGDNGDFDPQVELVEPDGTLTSVWNAGSAELNKTLSKAGTYMIIARERQGNQEGTYTLKLNIVK
jgi:hypothetical protein